ncbi:MAG: transcriptional repressor [Chloroflexaceae bacterium]|nr:transcriptional repressor [Chloroflexaceae bacterium]
MIQHLRAQGHRLTPQRRLIIEVLQGSDHHLSADEIAQQITLRYPTIKLDQATVYRTLNWLHGTGLVSATWLGQSHMVYADAGRHQHHHLICVQCQASIEANPQLFEPLRESLLRHYGFAARLDHLALFGLCAACQQAAGGQLFATENTEDTE